MNIDNVSMEGLGDNPQDMFIELEKRLNVELKNSQKKDREMFIDMNENYRGFYEPEIRYANTLLTFAKLYDLKIDLFNIGDSAGSNFEYDFRRFCNDVASAKALIKFRQLDVSPMKNATPATINQDFKQEIHDKLNTIRKIVTQSVLYEDKKDAIFKKISALQSEIDRNRTTIDAIFDKTLETSQLIKEVAENIKPAAEIFDKFTKILFSGIKKNQNLLEGKTPKLLAPREKDEEDNSDDGIPF